MKSNDCVYSCDINARVKIKIGSLEGKVKRPDFEKLLEDPLLKYSGLCQNNVADLRVEAQVFSQSKPISFPISTSYKAFTTRWSWNEWIAFPLRFSDLPRDALLVITIYDCGGPSKMIPVGGTTISLFSKSALFRQGMLDLRVWPGQVGDGNASSVTPGKGPPGNRMYKLTKLSKKHRMGQLPKLDWLDRLAFSEVETICEREKRDSDLLFLNIEFPSAEFSNLQCPIAYYEKEVEELDTADRRNSPGEIAWLPDHEILLENLVERKHHTLSRCVRSGVLDAEVKPTALVRDQLHAIVSYPPTQPLSAEEQDVIWKFRYYLSSNKKALAKFLKCVKWAISGEEKQALELLDKWSPMDVEDALELLGPQFTHPKVRSYAVARLRQAPDEDLLLYLLQLVQALKYEDFDGIKAGLVNIGGDAKESALLASLEEMSPGVSTAESTEDSAQPPMEISVHKMAVDRIDTLSENPDLASFLIYRACENTTLLNYFYWYLMIETEDQEIGVKQDLTVREMYLTILRRFLNCLKNGKAEWQERRSLLHRQQKFISKLVEVVKAVATESGNRQKKMEKLQSLLANPDALNMNFTRFEPLPLPLDPHVLIQGIVAKEATLFKSSQMPCKLRFIIDNGASYYAIFKHGDDLRQDQLILQIITLMDKLLRKENLDLKLTPYRVLATSTTHGFVQYINSTTVADVLASEGTIQNFFKKHHPSDSDIYGISAQVMDTYVKSCAGYCVITYLLGVGDRHLDNLLLTEEGALFHIDFGYILGRDPKPMPPPMKLSKEMVEAMGGITSEHYQEFKRLTYTAFLHLRRHANLILNLFSLMVGASVPDIALEPDKTVKKVHDKFRLELNDEAAVKAMQELIDLSVSAVMPALVEQIHKLTQMLRK